MLMSEKLADELNNERGISLWEMPTTGVTVFRPLTCSAEDLLKRLPEGTLSTCIVDDEPWLRSVAAIPLADIDEIISTILEAVH